MAATRIFRVIITCLLITLVGLVPFISAHGGGGNGSDDKKNSDSNLKSKGLILVKIWCLIIVFMATFMGGISPYFYRWNESFLLLGTQFAGGVFLGNALMHFLSDSARTFQDLTNKTYPFAFMLCTAGYLVTMLGDLIVAWVYARRERKEAAGHDSATLGTKDIHGVEKGGSPAQTGQTRGRSQEPVAKVPGISTSSVGDTVLLVLALCFHSVFEGIAIGVAETEAEAWKTLWTVCLHKIFAAIAMGIALLQIIPNRPFLSSAAYSLAFAISSPVGIAIGIIINATAEMYAAQWVYAISMGLACGIFVYVAINHLLAKGKKSNSQKQIPFDNQFYNYTAAVLGAGVIAVAMIWD